MVWLVVFFASDENMQVQVIEQRVLDLERSVFRGVEKSMRILTFHEFSHYTWSEAMGDQEGRVAQTNEPKNSDNIVQVRRSSDTDNGVVILDNILNLDS